jgi:hypothetical protein
MKSKPIKKILIWTVSVTMFLIAVLAVHIYIVTRPKIDPYTREMARIDIKQDINQGDANKIATWLYQQKGIDHVLVNPQTDIVVFTFYPYKTTAAQITSDFKSNFGYKAQRFIPTQDELMSSCPVAGSSVTYKVYNFFKHIF